MGKNYKEELCAEVEHWFSECTVLYDKLKQPDVEHWFDHEDSCYRFRLIEYGKHKLNIELQFAPEFCPIVTIYGKNKTKSLCRELTLNDEAFWKLKQLGLFDQLFVGALDKVTYDLGYDLAEAEEILDKQETTIEEVAHND